MFAKHGFRESTENVVRFESMDADTLEAIIKFIYTSSIDIKESNVYSLMMAADLFLVTSLRVSTYLNILSASYQTVYSGRTVQYLNFHLWLTLLNQSPIEIFKRIVPFAHGRLI